MVYSLYSGALCDSLFSTIGQSVGTLFLVPAQDTVSRHYYCLFDSDWKHASRVSKTKQVAEKSCLSAGDWDFDGLGVSECHLRERFG
jgi:hypothetical protein